MDYGELVTRAWTIFWRFRYVWLLGILGGASEFGGTSNFPGSYNIGGSSRAGRTGNLPAEVSDWLTANVGLLLALLGLLLLLALVYFVISCISTGALIRAGAEHDAERPFGLGLAWQAGRQAFWRILGLRLLLFVLVLLVAAVLGALIVVGMVSGLNDRPAGVAIAVVAGVGLVLLLIPVGIAFSIAVPFGTRAIVLEQRGILDALSRGFRLLFARLGRSLLVWLIGVGFGLLAGIVLALAVVVVALALGLIGLAVYAAFGVGAALAAGAVLLLLFIVATVVMAGLPGAYISLYWTLAFRRMEIDRQPAPAAPQPAAPGG